MSSSVPTLRHERELLRDGARLVIGCDEVGRGAIAGPVGVGLSVVYEHTRSAPVGLKDSKLLPEPKREELFPQVQRWTREHAVGLATNEEVESIGIIRALGLAAARALEALLAGGLAVQDAVVLLDGSHDWLTPALSPSTRDLGLRVTTKVKADRTCASVAAASVLAKVTRDRMMIASDTVHPGYLWASNKGYASAEHYAAIDALGPSPLHRWSWLRQPGLFDLEAG
jgi:ribonuclease HII